MIEGSDKIIACPNCKGLALHKTYLSGNTIGARQQGGGLE